MPAPAGRPALRQHTIGVPRVVHTPTRRTVLRTLAGIGAAVFGAAACGPAESGAQPAADGSAQPTADGKRRFGAEWESHTRTFMSWPALASVWEQDLPYVREDIARIARAIGGYEAVVMMARPDQVAAAQRACGSQVEVIPLAVDDLWARDTVPVFVEEGSKVIGVDFNFNGWGNKQEHTNDAQVGRLLLQKYGIPRTQAPLVAEGGSFETDGEGTLMVTESSIVNDNRNRGKSRDTIEAELEQTLGVQKVIWLAGVRGEDITDAHVDSLVRFTAPGVVLLDRAHPSTPPDSWSRSADQAKSVLSKATDARGGASRSSTCRSPTWTGSRARATTSSPRTPTSTWPTTRCSCPSSGTARRTTAPAGSCASTSRSGTSSW